MRVNLDAEMFRTLTGCNDKLQTDLIPCWIFNHKQAFLSIRAHLVGRRFWTEFNIFNNKCYINDDGNNLKKQGG